MGTDGEAGVKPNVIHAEKTASKTPISRGGRPHFPYPGLSAQTFEAVKKQTRIHLLGNGLKCIVLETPPCLWYK